MKKSSPDDLDNDAIARRLRILRQHVAGNEQGSQIRFASRIGIEYRRWNNFERGYPLSRDMAVHLTRAIPGLTTDWLFLGREDGLATKLHRELAEAGKAVILAEEEASEGSSKNRKTKSRM